MKEKIACLLILLLAPLLAGAQIEPERLYCTDADRATYERLVQPLEAKKALPVGELMVQAAHLFLETPYVAATLEKEPEGLVVNLSEMDCTTLAENVLAIVRTVKSADSSFEGFCRNLQQIRYRDGRIADYTDRLHYMTDWLHENSRKGLVEDVNREIGGSPLPLDLSFISTHPDSYKQLKGRPKLIRRMADKEKEINARTYFYLPTADIERQAASIADGDILCFVTTIKGLDVTHVGIACRVEDRLTFVHASSAAKKVVTERGTLAAYAAKTKTNKGLLVIRPADY